MKRLALSIYSMSLAVIGWEIVVRLRLVSILLIPSPLAVGEETGRLLMSPLWWLDIGATFFRFVIALMIGVSSGVISGSILGLWTKADETLMGWVDFFRSIPVAALIPLAMLFFGIGDSAKIAISAFVVALLMIVQTKYGIHDADSQRLTVGWLFGWNKITQLRRVVFFEALPAIMHGFRLALSLALIVVVVSEMIIGATHGVGTGILNAQLVYNTEEMYARIILIGVIGFAINALYSRAEDVVLHWVRN